jgi:hypothetical protein
MNQAMGAAGVFPYNQSYNSPCYDYESACYNWVSYPVSDPIVFWPPPADVGVSDPCFVVNLSINACLMTSFL